MTDVEIKVVLEMLFFKFSNTNVLFGGKKTFMLRFYITNKVLLIIKQIFMINPKEFIIAALNTANKIFIVHIAIQKGEKIFINFERQA